MTGFQGIEGVRLLPSDDPDDRVFRIVVGNSEIRDGMEGELKWTDPEGGGSVSVKGSVDVTMDVDTGVSLDWEGIEYFKFVPEVTATEEIDVSASDELELLDKKVEIGVLSFAPITFAIGPVPVWIQPEVKIVLGIKAKVGGNVSAGITLKQTARAGVVYNRNAGVNTVTEFTPSHELKPLTASLYAEVKPYVKVGPVMKIYSVTGPALNVKGYLKLRGKAEGEVFSSELCREGIAFSAFAGVEAEFEWDMGKAKKLGKWAENVDLSLTLWKKEVLLRKWNVGGNCGDSPPFMEIEGLDVYETVTENSGEVIRQDYIVKKYRRPGNGLGAFLS